MKDQKPELEHIEFCIAKTGENLQVKIASFPGPLFPAGDIVHCVLRVEDEKGNLWQFLDEVTKKSQMAIMFFPERMSADELELKCLEIVDNLETNGTPLISKKIK